MAATKRTWLWVILGVFGALFLLVVVLVGGAIFEFKRHVKNEWVDTAVAERQFDQQRARFRGQQPLIEFNGNERGQDDATLHRPAPDAPRVRINTLRVLVYDLRENHLIHVDIPGWVLRMMPNGRYGGFDGDDEFVKHRITLEDLERHGLGLVLDGQNPNTRILVWSE